MSIFIFRSLITESSLAVAGRFPGVHHHLQTPCKRRILENFSNKYSSKILYCNQARWFSRFHSSRQQGNHPPIYIMRPFCFTLLVSGVSLTGAAIWQYENYRHFRLTKFLFNRPARKYGEFRQQINNWWTKVSESDKVFYPICAINVLVFLAWKIPAWQPVMSRYFLSGVSSGSLCWPLLLSMFSHYNVLHLGANMFVLHSFSNGAVNALGKEEFVGLYLTGGIISSFTSYLYKAVVKSPRMSLGASGAVMCILGFICAKYPDSQLSVIFLPQFPFSAEKGIACLIAFDFMGCLVGWSILDHAAHLGGSLFGIFWHYYGHDHVWRRRASIIRFWHKLRTNQK